MYVWPLRASLKLGKWAVIIHTATAEETSEWTFNIYSCRSASVIKQVVPFSTHLFKEISTCREATCSFFPMDLCKPVTTQTTTRKRWPLVTSVCIYVLQSASLSCIHTRIYCLFFTRCIVTAILNSIAAQFSLIWRNEWIGLMWMKLNYYKTNAKCNLIV